MVEGPGGSLFGGHVGWRSHNHAHLGMGGGSHGGIADTGNPDIFSQSEIQHFDAALVADHHVARLQITVDDAFLMRRRERVGQRAANFDDALQGQALWRDQAVEGLPVDELHGQEVHAAGFFH